MQNPRVPNLPTAANLSRRKNLFPGAYWSQGRHVEDSNFQRYAYDLGVTRWDGSQWTSTKPGTGGKQNTDYYTFDQPVYAMSDGLVIGCNRSAKGNTFLPLVKQTGNVPGGNSLWVRTGNETQLYAHLKENSIPYSLCPFTDDQQHQVANPDSNVTPNPAYVIHAGQLIGHTGASGNSQGGPTSMCTRSWGCRRFGVVRTGNGVSLQTRARSSS